MVKREFAKPSKFTSLPRLCSLPAANVKIVPRPPRPFAVAPASATTSDRTEPLPDEPPFLKHSARHSGAHFAPPIDEQLGDILDDTPEDVLDDTPEDVLDGTAAVSIRSESATQR